MIVRDAAEARTFPGSGLLCHYTQRTAHTWNEHRCKDDCCHRSTHGNVVDYQFRVHLKKKISKLPVLLVMCTC